MHRNSLQYRLDRFHENTGIDVRKFEHAMAVYLAILIKSKCAQKRFHFRQF
ncbi:helix-turn-helix domain-containing protein [Planococcus sp. MB-3u-03]|uniref:helix-turn-helix domain-containing protein n=1 Tax=Planococcus sp. MB-3u-03 TaxID=2058136 RepID=UPI001E3767F0|nr:helix-turn-helix domain-containing protein [Planococcus sp. MB-3u-03]